MAYDSTFTALADPTRRKVMEVLAIAPCHVAAIAEKLPVSRPAVSQHLKVLTDAGLVTMHAKGARRIYAVRPEGLAELRDWLDRFWTDALDAFAQKIAQEEGKHRD